MPDRDQELKRPDFVIVGDIMRIAANQDTEGRTDADILVQTSGLHTRSKQPSLLLAGRMQAHCRPQQTNLNDSRTIHIQRFDGCPPHNRLADKTSAIVAPAKVVVPALSSGVEEPRAAARPRVAPRDLGTLRIVADGARGAQVVWIALPAQRLLGMN